MPSTDRITLRARQIRRQFGISPEAARLRAERECDLANYWTPWELLDSAHAARYVAWYIQSTTTTVQ